MIMNFSKKLTFKLISYLLCIITIISSLIVYSAASGSITELRLATYRYSSSENYESDSTAAKRMLTDNGFAVANEDLNRGVYGDYVFLGYKYNSGSPITDIKAVKNNNAENTIIYNVNGNNCTYYLVKDNSGNAVDLNKNAYGNADVIYLYYTTDENAGAPITGITVATSSSLSGHSVVTWMNSDSPADMNSGARRGTSSMSGEYPLFLHFTSINSTGKYMPLGYDFFRDSFDFINFSATIDKKYFQNMYDEAPGYDLWKKHKNQGGVCYGLAYTTYAIYNGYPFADTFSCVDGLTVRMAECIRDLNKGSAFNQGATTIIGGNEITITDYIKYSQILQYSVAAEKAYSEIDINTLCSIVKDNAMNNEVGTLICIYNNDGEGHAVLAVGVEGNSILVDDSNHREGLERIVINDDGTWYFTGIDGWNSSICTLGIQNLSNYAIYYALITDFGRKNQTRAAAMPGDFQYFDSDKLLLTLSCDDCSFDQTSAIKINSIEGSGLSDSSDENNSNSDLYWVEDDNSITINNVCGKDNEFRLSGGDHSIVINTDECDSLTLNMDNKNNDIGTKITAEADAEYSISSVEYNEGDRYEIKITGTAESGEIIAKVTDDGMKVAGLNNAEISYSKNEETVATDSAKVDDGREINIIANSKNETVNADYTNGEVCKYCGKTHGNSFVELFIKFIHKIIYFVTSLF